MIVPARDVGTPPRRTRWTDTGFLRRGWVPDILVAAGFFALWSTGIGVALTVGWYPTAVSDYYLVGELIAIALLLCRRAPVAGLAIVGLGSAWPWWSFDQSEIRILPLVVAGFLATSFGLRMTIAIPVAVVSATLALLPVLSFTFSSLESWLSTISSFLVLNDPSTRVLAGVVVLAALLLGRSIRRQRIAMSELADRNRELVQLRDADIARAAAEERTAVARDIHDVVAHHIAAMVIRAQAAERVAESRPEELRSAVNWIVTSGQDALASMRRVVRVLRGTPAGEGSFATGSFAMGSFDAEVRSIAERVRDTGVDVDADVRVDGTLTPEQEAAILRIAQEALTNVMLHSTARRVRLAIRGTAGHATLTVTDDGEPVEIVAPSPTGGNGIPGMRERVRELGGSLEVGPVGAWLVDVRPVERTAGDVRFGEYGEAGEVGGTAPESTSMDGWRVFAELPSRAAVSA